MDAFEKWWASAVVTHEDGLISLPSHKAAFLDGKAEGIKEGMRRAAEIANAVGQIGQASAEGTVQVDPMAKRISVAILKEIGE